MKLVKTIFGTLLIGVVVALTAYLLGFLSCMFKTVEEGFKTQSFHSPPTDLESIALGLTDWEHLRWALVLVGALAVVILIIIIKGKIENRNRDERNFTVSKKGTYGTANGLTRKKAKKLLTADGEHHLLSVRKEIRSEDTGIILGTFPNGAAVLKNVINKENMNIFVCGAPGSGKSYMFVRPYLAQCIRREESFVCTDPSGELLETMGGYAKACGYKVKVFNLVDPSKSDSWNIIEEIKGNQLLAQIAATTIIRNTLEGERGDPFWDNGEKNLLKALLLYVGSEMYTGEKSLGEMYLKLSASDFQEATLAVLEELSETHPAKMPYNIYAQATEQVQSSFASGLATRLQIFQSEAIRNMTAFDDIDLTAPGREKCAYFVVMSDQDSTYQLLSSLFFSFFFMKLADYGRICPHQSLPVKVNVVLDELPSIGMIPDLGRKLATVRKYGINVVPIVQLISQLDNRYSPAERDEIIGCCDTQVWLGSTDSTSAEVLSDRSGTMTVDVSSKSEKATTIDSGIQLTSSIGRRPYLTMDEVLRIPLDEVVIVLRGQNVMKLRKYKFRNHPDYKKIESAEKISLSTYEPEYKAKSTSSESKTKKVNLEKSDQPEIPIQQPKRQAQPQAQPQTQPQRQQTQDHQKSENPKKGTKKPKAGREPKPKPVKKPPNSQPQPKEADKSVSQEEVRTNQQPTGKTSQTPEQTAKALPVQSENPSTSTQSNNTTGKRGRSAGFKINQ